MVVVKPKRIPFPVVSKIAYRARAAKSKSQAWRLDFILAQVERRSNVLASGTIVPVEKIIIDAIAGECRERLATQPGKNIEGVISKGSGPDPRVIF